VAVVDAEQVQAAVTVALDASMARMVEEITRHVLVALETQATNRPAAPQDDAPAPEGEAEAPPAPEEQEAPEEEESPWPEPVRRVTPLRRRSGSILGLDEFPTGDKEPPVEE
jgi:hypothetical protein